MARIITLSDFLINPERINFTTADDCESIARKLADDFNAEAYPRAYCWSSPEEAERDAHENAVESSGMNIECVGTARLDRDEDGEYLYAVRIYHMYYRRYVFVEGGEAVTREADLNCGAYFIEVEEL